MLNYTLHDGVSSLIRRGYLLLLVDVGFGTTSGWYEGSCPLYIRNFRITGTAKTLTDTDSTALGAHSTQVRLMLHSMHASLQSCVLKLIISQA